MKKLLIILATFSVIFAEQTYRLKNNETVIKEKKYPKMQKLLRFRLVLDQ